MEIKNNVLISVENDDIDENGHFIIPSDVTSVGEYAFLKNTKLISIIIPERVVNIENSAFFDCEKLESIVIHKGLISIGSNSFSNCAALVSIVIHGGTTSIGLSAFSDCNELRSILILDGTTVIGNNAFFNCNQLQSITIFGGETYIGNAAFSECNKLSSIVIPEGTTHIEDHAFFNCSQLTSFFIPNKVKSIGSLAFGFCDNLTTIVIPKSVTSIGADVFLGCKKLSTIKVKANSLTDLYCIKALLPKEFEERVGALSNDVIKIQKIALKKLYRCLSASPMMMNNKTHMAGLEFLLPLEIWQHIHSFLGDDYPYKEEAQKKIDNIPLPKEFSRESMYAYKDRCDKVVIKYIRVAEKELGKTQPKCYLTSNSFFNGNNDNSSNGNKKNISDTSEIVEQPNNCVIL